jgi:hypothetical protein
MVNAKANTQKTISEHTGLRWIMIIGFIFCELFVYTWVRTQPIRSTMELTQANQNILKKLSYAKALSIERDRLKSDKRIITIAKTRLNLLTDTTNRVIYLPEAER